MATGGEGGRSDNVFVRIFITIFKRELAPHGQLDSDGKQAHASTRLTGQRQRIRKPICLRYRQRFQLRETDLGSTRQSRRIHCEDRWHRD